MIVCHHSQTKQRRELHADFQHIDLSRQPPSFVAFVGVHCSQHKTAGNHLSWPAVKNDMDIETFLRARPAWALEPCLYIVKQTCPGNNAYRCGASGTHLFKGADIVYGAGSRRGGVTGLLSRIEMYKGFWEPVRGTIYAALRIRRQLVAKPGQRTSGVSGSASVFNVDRGNQSVVREA